MGKTLDTDIVAWIKNSHEIITKPIDIPACVFLKKKVKLTKTHYYETSTHKLHKKIREKLTLTISINRVGNFSLGENIFILNVFHLSATYFYPWFHCDTNIKTLALYKMLELYVDLGSKKKKCIEKSAKAQCEFQNSNARVRAYAQRESRGSFFKPSPRLTRMWPVCDCTLILHLTITEEDTSRVPLAHPRPTFTRPALSYYQRLSRAHLSVGMRTPGGKVASDLPLLSLCAVRP